MKTLHITMCMLLLANLGIAQSAEHIVQRSENLMKGVSSHGRFRMSIETPDFSRTMEMDAWWVGEDKALITITSPRREAGNKTLKVKNELWMYLRNTETTMKIPPSMMLQSWNGSDFTNDDLVRESNLVKDYHLRILGEEVVDGVPTWKIELIPRPEAPVVWGKIHHWVRKQDDLAARTEYYDEKGSLVRTMTYADVRAFGKRRIPARWEMRSNVKPGHRTAFEYLEAEFDITIPDRIFSFRELEKGRK
jgi:outer membrane lipoprotein-sorting protein